MKVAKTELQGTSIIDDLNLNNNLNLCNAEFIFSVQNSILNLINGFFFILDDSMVIKYISSSITNKLGFLSEDLFGKHFDVLFNAESAKQIHTLLSLNISQGKTWEKDSRIDVEVIGLNKLCYSYQLSLSEIENSDFYIGICFDIDDQRKKEKELLAQKQTAEFNDRMKSEFLANMSHEIRTPLNGIVGFTSMLDRKELPEDKREKYLRIIHSSTQHLLTLVSDIIDISKIEAGQLKLSYVQVDVHQLLEDLQATFVAEANRLGKKNIRIIKQIEKPSAHLTINCDEIRLKQVLNNLLGNALKFTNDGDIRFGYTIMNDKTIRFYVRDSGIGISKAAQKIIFNRFKQTKEGEKDIYKGFGLGLAISKGIIEIMGGKIDVISEPENGAEFFFTLPNNE
jgi:signal transduction histidine kinase